MNFFSVPRQPFIGLAIVAATGIIVADFLPLPSLLLMLLVLGSAVAALMCPSSILVYVLVGIGFFWIHAFRLKDSPGMRLAAHLSGGPVAVTATGAVVSEPK